MKPLRKKKKIKPTPKSKVVKVKAPEVPVHIIAHSKATMGRQEEQAAAKVIHGGFVGSGSEVAKFEYDFCRFLGLAEGHALALSSGTAARYLALAVLGAEGKSVAIPAYSSGLRKALALAKAVPVVVDVKAGTANIDLDAAAATRADIVVIAHMFGMPTVLKPMAGKKIIEDCTQVLGAKIKGVPAGLAADIAVYSFAGGEIITCGGQGGMLVSKDLELVTRARAYRDHDNNGASFNFRLTDIQAAIGRVQLEKLPKLVARREDIFDAYKESGFAILEAHDESVSPVRQAAILQTERAQEVISYLKEACVECIVPVDLVSASEASTCPQAAHLALNTVSLPIHPHLSNDEVREIMDQLHDALAPAEP